jgi:hypothetical protein
VFSAVLVGAPRPPWTPYADPREDALVEVYELLLAAQGLLGEEAIS